MTERHAEALKQLKAAKAKHKAEMISNITGVAAGLGSVAIALTAFCLLLNTLAPHGIDQGDPNNWAVTGSLNHDTVDVPTVNTRQYWDSQPAEPVVHDWSVVENVVITGDSYSVSKLANEIRSAANVYVDIHQNHWDWAGEADATVYFDRDFRSLTLSGVEYVWEIERYLPKLKGE